MKYLAAILGVALAVAVAANVYQAVPPGGPSEPAYVQKVRQLLDSSNTGDWKAACDAAPTAAYSYQDFVSIAIMYGATSLADLNGLCEKMLKGALTDVKGKPVGLDYTILWWSPDDGKATPATDRLVIVRLHWHQRGIPAATVIFHVSLQRIAWFKQDAKCKGKPCPSLRWYVLGAT